MKLQGIMVLSAFGLLAFLSDCAQAGEVILEEGELSTLQERAREQPYRKRWSLEGSDLLPYEIGRPATPFFKKTEGGISSRRYQAGNRCFEVEYLSGVNRVSRMKCRDLLPDLRLPGLPGFRANLLGEVLKDFARGTDRGFEIASNDQTYLLRGFIHEEAMIRMDQQVLGLSGLGMFPSRDFSVSLKSEARVAADPENALVVSHSLELKLGALGILPERKLSFRSRIVRSADDLIFTGQNGSWVILNHLLLPAALRDQMPRVDPSWQKTLEQMQLASRTAPVCFRDSWSGGKLDCHHRIEQLRLLKHDPFRILLVDFKQNQVEMAP